jgi:hypothetical protein
VRWRRENRLRGRSSDRGSDRRYRRGSALLRFLLLHRCRRREWLHALRDGEDEALELEVQVLGIGTGKCQKSGVDGEGKEVVENQRCWIHLQR